MAKQVCDIQAGKGMSVNQSNEHLRVGHENAYAKKITGTMDPTREHLNFEIGREGVVKEVDKHTSISRRIRENLKARGIIDPNAGLDQDDPRRRITVANIILQGSRDVMRQMAFGNQEVNYERGADNSQVVRQKDIETWATDMYRFMAKKYGEDNIAAFVVHLDETNPHCHCTLLPITPKGKFSYNYFFGGKDEGPKKLKLLHDELSEVNAKYGLERGESVALTGAKHKSYLQWVKEEISTGKETIHEQEHTISQQSATISARQQHLYDINAEIRKANKKLKALTTMVNNLETKKADIEAQINQLNEDYNKGKISYDEMVAKKTSLEGEKATVEEQLADKQGKLKTAIQELKENAQKKHQLELDYEQLRRDINKNLPMKEERDFRDVNAELWRQALPEVEKEYAALEEFSQKLPPGLKMEFDSLMEGTFIEDIAERGNQIAAVTVSLFNNYIDEATKFAESHGGGGGGPGSGWGKDRDEDDEAYRRRCCIMGRMMMQPVGRKLKRN